MERIIPVIEGAKSMNYRSVLFAQNMAFSGWMLPDGKEGK